MKKILLFGSEKCPDCAATKELLEKHQIRYSYIDILDSLGKLKIFLHYRDTLPEFGPVKEAASIGIPFLLINDGEWVALGPPSDSLVAKLKA